MSDSWSNNEVDIIVADYFSMLLDELSGKIYNKTEHRKQLIPLLNNRSAGSIEFKHQNISAILIRLGQLYISGYLPRYNYQKVLENKVIEYLSSNLSVENHFKVFIEEEISISQKIVDFQNFIVAPPKGEKILNEPFISYQKKPIKINYLEREQTNRNLGLFGEELVLNYEKWNLRMLGKEKLAEKIEWVSKEIGDGAGFDILSKNINGTDKYIEVKTTKLGKETPFYFSMNELNFSMKNTTDYHLFRLFNANNNVKMFIKNGALNKICSSIPILYKGFF
jgi:hypothetical protein